MYYNWRWYDNTYDHSRSVCGLHGSAKVDPDGPQPNLDSRGSCGYNKMNTKEYKQLNIW